MTHCDYNYKLNLYNFFFIKTMQEYKEVNDDSLNVSDVKIDPTLNPFETDSEESQKF